MPTPTNAGNVLTEALFVATERTENVNYTIDSAGPDQMIRSQTAGLVFTLVDVTANDGRVLTFKDLSGGPSPVFILRPVLGQTIDGVAGDFSFFAPHGAISIRGNAGSSNWDVVDASSSNAEAFFTQQYLLSATNIFAGGPTSGTRLVKFTGCGNGGSGGGGSGGTALGVTGNGGGGGGASLYQNFDVFIDFTHRIDVIIPANAAAGTAGGVGTDGGNGGDGGTCYILDFTANVVLCAFAGGSGGALGSVLAGPGLGGASFPNGQRAGNFTTGSQGFLAAGGNGGSQTGPVTPGIGNFNLSTFGLTPPGPAPNLYAGGAAGVNGAAGQGGGGGGGGQGSFGSGGAGGSGNAGTGTNGGDVNVGNPGSGGGGGAGGAVSSAGARGGIGSLGQITYSYRT